MTTLTVLCNIVLLGFTCVVLATDGPPMQAAYILFTLWLMLIPIFTVFAIVRSKAGHGWQTVHMNRNTLEAQSKTDALSSRSIVMERVAAICNIVLLGFVCWALVEQYPHPEEEGVVAFTVLTVLTPILSAVVLFRREPSDRPRGPHMKSEALEEQR